MEEFEGVLLTYLNRFGSKESPMTEGVNDEGREALVEAMRTALERGTPLSYEEQLKALGVVEPSNDVKV